MKFFGDKLDKAQTALDVAGAAPGPLGTPADIANTAISAARSGYSLLKGNKSKAKEHAQMAGLNLAAAIPGLGKIAEAFKLNKKASNIVKMKDTAKTITKESQDKIAKRASIETPHYGVIKSEKDVATIVGSITAKGKNFDAYKGPLSPEHIKKMPTVSHRDQLLVDIPNVGKQVFYKSTSKGGKIDKFGAGTKDRWIPLAGYADTPGTNNWFVKSKGFDKGYGSKFFEQLYDQPQVLSSLYKK